MTRTRSARAAALALALVLPLGLVACGGDGDDSAEVVEESDDTTTTAAGGDQSTTTEDEGSDDSTTTTIEGSDDPTTTVGGGGGSTSDLASILLTESDLPAGWTRDGEDDTSIDMGDDEPLCPGGEVPSFEPVEQVSRDFGLEDANAFSLVSTLAARFDGDQAEQALDYFRDEIARCGTTPGEDGEQYALQEVPGIGDEAITIVVTNADDPSIGGFNIYFARVDDVLLGLYAFVDPATGIDGEELIAVSAGRA